MTNALITGWGMYAPSRIMTNDDLTKLVDTSDEWIEPHRDPRAASPPTTKPRPRSASTRPRRWRWPASTPARST